MRECDGKDLAWRCRESEVVEEVFPWEKMQTEEEEEEETPAAEEEEEEEEEEKEITNL